jgi:hypothetical protein
MVMTYKNNIFSSINVTKDAKAAAHDDENALADLMANPEYLRHSSAIINEALKDGFDVLQLPNGDIVTNGTKIITHVYAWDAAKSKLVKGRAPTEKQTRSRKAKASVDADEDAE